MQELMLNPACHRQTCLQKQIQIVSLLPLAYSNQGQALTFEVSDLFNHFVQTATQGLQPKRTTRESGCLLWQGGESRAS